MQDRKCALPKPSDFSRHWQLSPDTVFLNHGSFGACPAHVLRIQNRLRDSMEAEPVQFLWRHYESMLEPSRRILAEFVGANSADLVFVTNATTGINAVVRSLRLHRGDEILTTNLDYNACHNVLVEAARRADARIVTASIPFPLQSPDSVVEAIMRAVSRRTRLALIDHVTSNTALVLPIVEIIRALDSRGVDTLVDGAHAPGMLPLNLRKLRPAYYAANLHKWVCAPKGAGFLWVRPDKQSEVQPAVISHGNNRRRPRFTPFQDRFDWAGTSDPSPWFCVGEAIRFLGGLLPGGWSELYRRNHHLAVAARKAICSQLNTDPVCPEVMLGAMATIRLPSRFQRRVGRGKISSQQSKLYDVFRIEVPFMRFGHPPRQWLRISAQLYNSLPEYEYLASSLQQL